MATRGTKAALSLQGDLDIFAIRSQAEALKARLPRRGDVTLDLAGLGDVDLSGFQLLAALHRTVQEAGGRLALQGIPPEVEARMRSLGFGGLLGEVRA